MTTGMMNLRELTIRYAVKRTGEGLRVPVVRRIKTVSECAAAFSALLGDQSAEVFAVLCLSTKLDVIGYHEVSRGTLDGTPVHPREVFKAAILANASAIVGAHNHPSGDPTPSTDDVALTARLVAAGDLLGIPLLDHLVIGQGRCVSLLELGCLRRRVE